MIRRIMVQLFDDMMTLKDVFVLISNRFVMKTISLIKESEEKLLILDIFLYRIVND